MCGFCSKLGRVYVRILHKCSDFAAILNVDIYGFWWSDIGRGHVRIWKRYGTWTLDMSGFWIFDAIFDPPNLTELVHQPDIFYYLQCTPAWSVCLHLLLIAPSLSQLGPCHRRYFTRLRVRLRQVMAHAIQTHQLLRSQDQYSLHICTSTPLERLC